MLIEASAQTLFWLVTQSFSPLGGVRDESWECLCRSVWISWTL